MDMQKTLTNSSSTHVSLHLSTEEGALFAETMKELKEKTQFADVTSPENLMPYDPAIPQGKEGAGGAEATHIHCCRSIPLSEVI